MAVESKLGWLLFGPTETCMLSENIHSNLVIDEPGTTPCMGSENNQLQSILKLFWEVKSTPMMTVPIPLMNF